MVRGKLLLLLYELASTALTTTLGFTMLLLLLLGLGNKIVKALHEVIPGVD